MGLTAHVNKVENLLFCVSFSATVLSIMLPNSSCLETGGTLRCVCWVEAHPVAKVTWMVSGKIDLPASVIPNITTEGNFMSSEVLLEGKLAEQESVVCVANNSHSTETHQMTTQSAATSGIYKKEKN